MPQRTFFFILCLIVGGCRASSKNIDATKVSADSPQEAVSAVKSVAGALTGQTFNDRDARHLAREIQRDPEAQSAVQSITGAMNAAKSNIKYCPRDGKRFSSRLEYCPEHRVPLKMLDE